MRILKRSCFAQLFMLMAFLIGTSDMWVPPEQLSIMNDALSEEGVTFDAMPIEVDRNIADK